MRPILYLLAIEDVARSPLIRSQVFGLLKTIRAAHPEWPIVLVALYPAANRLRFRRQLREVRAELASAQIRVQVIPIAFLTRYFYIPRLLLPLFLIQALPLALWIALRWRPALVHCRAYPAALVGHMIKRLCGAGLLFDTRALYPEEGATLEEGSKTVLLDEPSVAVWKRLESTLMASSDAVTVVSAPSVEILAPQYPAARSRMAVLPTFTRVEQRSTLAEWRAQARQELGLTDEIVVAYAGSWFEKQPTLAVFNLLLESLPAERLFFLMLVSKNAQGDDAQASDRLTALVRAELGLGANCRALAVPQRRVSFYLAAADLAAQPVGVSDRFSVDERYVLTARTRISIKFTEYLACGLPVLVSRWAGAAAALVEEHELGVVYNRASPAEVARWLAGWRAAQADYQERVWAFARAHFAVENVAEGYARLYQQILAQRRR